MGIEDISHSSYGLLLPEWEIWGSFSKTYGCVLCFDLLGTSLNTWLTLFCTHQNYHGVGEAFGVIFWNNIKAHTCRGWLSWLEHCPIHRKGDGFDPLSRHVQKATNLSLPLSLSLSQISEYILRRGLK